jgi:uncharacterized membrane protein YuzA (DUF378 family)
MKTLHFITWLLIIIGALNWLLVGAFGWDVGMLFGGQMAIVSRIIYILVGVSAIYEIFTHKNTCKMCAMSSMPAGGMMK